ALPGGTNSATCSWYFNLGNNSDGSSVTNLDTTDGGYTVFGQVKSGMNVLQYFNTVGYGTGLQNMTNDFHANFCSPLYLYPDGAQIGFDALPVGFFGYDCLRYSDLFNVQILVLPGPDRTPPKVAVTSPAANSTDTNLNVQVTGTASDNLAVASVRVYLN